MKKKADKILAKCVLIATIAVLAGLIIATFTSCEKQEPAIDHLNHHDSINGYVRLGNVEYWVIIECWGTGVHGWEDDVICMPAYDVAAPWTARTIYYNDYDGKARRFKVSVRPEPYGKEQYLGWGIVTDSLIVDRALLNPEYIEFDCEK